MLICKDWLLVAWEGQETIHVFMSTSMINQLEGLFFKSLPWSLSNVCQIFHEYNTKIIHHFLQDNLIPTGLNIHLMNTKTSVAEQSSCVVPRATHPASLLGCEDLASVSCLLSFPLVHDSGKDTGKSIMCLGNTTMLFSVSNCCIYCISIMQQFLPSPYLYSIKTLRYSVFPGLAILFSCWALSPLPAKKRVKRIHADLKVLCYVSALICKPLSVKKNFWGENKVL